jgi:hypothetical protein
MSAESIERIELASGTAAELRRPSDWNGFVVVQPDLWSEAVDVRWEEWLAECGFASIRHSRETRGWLLAAARKDDQEARERFAARFGDPQKGFLAFGASLGGLTVRWLLERDDSGYLGGVALDGGGGGALSPFERVLDALFALNELFGLGEPLIAADVASAWEAGLRVGRAVSQSSTALEHAYIDVALALWPLPAWSDPNEPRPLDAVSIRAARARALTAQLPGANAIRAEVESTLGGAFVGNAGVDYRELLMRTPVANALAESLEAAGSSLDAVLSRLERGERLEALPERAQAVVDDKPITGAITRPLVVLRTLGDPAAVVNEEHTYMRMLAASGTDELARFAWVDGPGHVNTSVAERAAALMALVERLESGRWKRADAASWAELAASEESRSGLDMSITREPVRFAEPRATRFVDFAPPPLSR